MKQCLSLLFAMISFGQAHLFAAGQVDPTIVGMTLQDNHFFEFVSYGMLAAADDFNAELLFADSGWNVGKELALLKVYEQSNVDALVIAPADFSESIPAVSALNRRGPPVITYFTTLDADFPVSFVGSNNIRLGVAIGRATRDYVNKHIDGAVTLAILTFDTLNPRMNTQRIDAFLSEIALVDSPNVEVAARVDGHSREAAFMETGQIIDGHPDLDIIFAAGADGTIGAVEAVRASGKKIAIFGIDFNEQLIDALLAEDEILQAVAIQQPYQIGYETIRIASQAARRMPVDNIRLVPTMLLRRDDPNGVILLSQQLVRYRQRYGARLVGQ